MSIEVLIVTYLFTKHLVADFFYQPPYQWQNKGTYGHPGGIIHSGQHILLTSLLYFMVPMSLPMLFSILAFEFIVHYHMDWFKMWWNKKQGYTPMTPEFWIWLGVDQWVHAMSYIIILFMLI